MSEHLDAPLGPNQQAEIKTLIEQIVTPLQAQIAEQAETIKELKQKLYNIELRLPQENYLTSGGNAAILGVRPPKK